MLTTTACPDCSVRSARAARWARAVLVLAFALATTGCQLCADCDEQAYAAYGGVWQRLQREDGRVGSVFNPAGGKVPRLVERDEPLEPDELDRRRRAERLEGDDAPGQADAPTDEPEPSDDNELRRQRQEQDFRDLEGLELQDISTTIPTDEAAGTGSGD